MLPVNDQESRFRIFQITYRFKLPERTKLQYVCGKQKHAARNGRLRFSRLVKVDDFADFPPAEESLKRFLTPLDFSDELRYRVVAIGLGLNGFPFEVESAGKPDAALNGPRLERDKRDNGVFLPYAGCEQ